SHDSASHTHSDPPGNGTDSYEPRRGARQLLRSEATPVVCGSEVLGMLEYQEDFTDLPAKASADTPGNARTRSRSVARWRPLALLLLLISLLVSAPWKASQSESMHADSPPPADSDATASAVEI